MDQKHDQFPKGFRCECLLCKGGCGQHTKQTSDKHPIILHIPDFAVKVETINYSVNTNQGTNFIFTEKLSFLNMKYNKSFTRFIPFFTTVLLLILPALSFAEKDKILCDTLKANLDSGLVNKLRPDAFT